MIRVALIAAAVVGIAEEGGLAKLDELFDAWDTAPPEEQEREILPVLFGYLNAFRQRAQALHAGAVFGSSGPRGVS